MMEKEAQPPPLALVVDLQLHHVQTAVSQWQQGLLRPLRSVLRHLQLLLRLLRAPGGSQPLHPLGKPLRHF